jgi:hypothetical protein
MKKLTALDSLFLTTESSQAPTHAGILQIFDLPPKAGISYVDRVYETFLKAQPVAPWNCHPDLNPLGGGRWRPAEEQSFRHAEGDIFRYLQAGVLSVGTGTRCGENRRASIGFVSRGQQFTVQCAE